VCSRAGLLSPGTWAGWRNGPWNSGKKVLHLVAREQRGRAAPQGMRLRSMAPWPAAGLHQTNSIWGSQEATSPAGLRGQGRAEGRQGRHCRPGSGPMRETGVRHSPGVAAGPGDIPAGGAGLRGACGWPGRAEGR